MKTMKNLILILTFIFGLTLTSCSKYDDFLPEQNDKITQINKKYINTDTVTIMNEEINKYQIRAEIKIKAKVFEPSTYNWDSNNGSSDYYYYTKTINMSYYCDTLLTNTELEDIKTNKSINLHNNYMWNIQNESSFREEIWIEPFLAQLNNDQNCYLPKEYEKYRDKWQFFYYDNDGILKTTDNIKSFEFTNIEIKKIK